MMKKIILTVVVCSLSLLSTSAFSQRGYLKTVVNGVLIHDEDFGKCMVKLDKKLNTVTQRKGWGNMN
jgi:hypothetical protein